MAVGLVTKLYAALAVLQDATSSRSLFCELHLVLPKGQILIAAWVRRIHLCAVAGKLQTSWSALVPYASTRHSTFILTTCSLSATTSTASSRTPSLSLHSKSLLWSSSSPPSRVFEQILSAFRLPAALEAACRCEGSSDSPAQLPLHRLILGQESQGRCNVLRHFFGLWF